ncbi:DUF1768 domain-containing protein [Pedobacter sp. KBW01]|uniref:NADAR family protein n=1 Tax=Pedobacter sp. KBW01 TaxID=2153364 RepID=UPI000F5B765E|nr:NADAR family protein [Pedobacter sp. KBW01]RQO77758.1 DUF1768 domain-containing protein [Pedobacter sp. KBW01]
MVLSSRTYKKDECITFKSTKGKYGALSNMAPNLPLFISGHKILSAEALYQALRFPDRADIQRNILGYKSPISAKNYARSVMDFNRPDWDRQRFAIMRFCIELKLYQHYDIFSNVLKSTSGYNIVEYTDKDKVWGAVEDGEYYVGTNALGRLLMELRENLLNGNFSLRIPNIPHLNFLGSPVTSERIDPPSVHDRLF